MITQYEVRVRRPWGPSVKRGDIIKVSGRRRLQLIRLSVVVDVEKQKPPVKKAAPNKATTKTKRRA